MNQFTIEEFIQNVGAVAALIGSLVVVWFLCKLMFRYLLSPHDESWKTAPRRVGDVKAAYGELLSDLVYRIENPALFDSKVPATKEFELLLMRWDDEEKGLSPETAARLAGELELAFAAARKNAETLGIRHLPRTARKNGQKAAHAARLAQQATTTGEREAAMATVIRLLDALALYYMPTPHDIPKMLTGEHPSITSN